jgi:hypothetical protein
MQTENKSALVQAAVAAKNIKSHFFNAVCGLSIRTHMETLSGRRWVGAARQQE